MPCCEVMSVLGLPVKNGSRGLAAYPRMQTQFGNRVRSEKRRNGLCAAQQTAYQLVGSGALILREPIGRYLSGCYNRQTKSPAVRRGFELLISRDQYFATTGPP